MIYGETLVIGLDLEKIKHLRPRGVSEADWWSEYKGFWPVWLQKHPHHSLFMFAHGMPPETIVFGCRAEYYFTHFGNKTPDQFKKIVAREAGRVLKTPVDPKLITHYFVQYTLDEEDEYEPE